MPRYVSSQPLTGVLPDRFSSAGVPIGFPAIGSLHESETLRAAVSWKRKFVAPGPEGPDGRAWYRGDDDKIPEAAARAVVADPAGRRLLRRGQIRPQLGGRPRQRLSGMAADRHRLSRVPAA